MEILDLTTDKSKTLSDGIKAPAKTDAMAPPPESQSIKQAKNLYTRNHDTSQVTGHIVPRHPFQRQR